MVRRKALTAVAVAAVALAVAAASYAGFTSGASAIQSVSTNALNPPTGVTATKSGGCGNGQQVAVGWTLSTSAYVTGYTIQRSGTTIATLAASATSYTDTTVARSTSYTYTVLATYKQWSAGANAAVTTC